VSKTKTIILGVILILVVATITIITVNYFYHQQYPKTFNDEFITRLENDPDWECDQIYCTYDSDDEILTITYAYSTEVFGIKSSPNGTLDYTYTFKPFQNSIIRADNTGSSSCNFNIFGNLKCEDLEISKEKIQLLEKARGIILDHIE